MGPLALIPKAKRPGQTPPGQGQGHPFQTFYLTLGGRAFRPSVALAHTWSLLPDRWGPKTLLMAPGHRGTGSHGPRRPVSPTLLEWGVVSYSAEVLGAPSTSPPAQREPPTPALP